jgi:hypothetical protein
MKVVDHSTTEAIDDGWQQPRSYLEGGVAVGGESVTCQEMKSAVQAGEQVGLQHEKPPEAAPPANSAAAFDPTVEKDDAVGAATQPTDKSKCADVASKNAPEHPHTLFLRYRTHQATCCFLYSSNGGGVARWHMRPLPTRSRRPPDGVQATSSDRQRASGCMAARAKRCVRHWRGRT